MGAHTMDITNIFYTRDQSFAKINLAMNYLSRLVRENLTVFDYDAGSGEIAFLSDSDKLMKAVIEPNGDSVTLTQIQVEPADELFSNEKIDEAVNSQVSKFVHSLHGDSYPQAEVSFSKLLNIFESRGNVNEARSKLEKRRARFSEVQDITDTPEFVKLAEVKEQLIDYVKENKSSLMKYEDIINSAKLTHALGKVFKAPTTTWDDLVSEGSVKIPYDSKKTVFEMICTQELIRTELVESKENFARTWIKNPKIAALASCIYNDDAAVEKALHEALTEIPYLALAAKADIKRVFSAVYESSDVKGISQKDIREYVAKIFEMKKPLKVGVIRELNESYGINVQNLKFVPTFSNLAKAQSVFFEALSRISEKESVVRDVCSNFANSLHKKNGIQTLTINDFIAEILESADINTDGELFRVTNLDTVMESVQEAKKKDDGESKGDKGKDKDDPKAKDYENGGDRKGDKSKSGKGKDFEDEDEDPVGKKNGKNGNGKDFGGNKGDKSKTHPGEEDYENGEEDEDEFPLAKDKNGKKKKKKGKNGKNGDEESDLTPAERADENIEQEYATPEEEEDLDAPAGTSEMDTLMGELEQLFKEVDWEAIAQEDDETEYDGEDDFSDRQIASPDGEFNDEEPGTPDTEQQL